jgi:hypothetical protein
VQRDMDLVRKILLFIEKKEDDHPIFYAPFEGYDEIILLEHYHLIFEAGLVRGETVCSTTTPDRVIKVIPFDVLKAVLIGLCKEAVKDAVKGWLTNTSWWEFYSLKTAPKIPIY